MPYPAETSIAPYLIRVACAANYRIMQRLIHAFEALFANAALAGGELARTASFTLENVNWKGTLNQPGPMTHQMVDTHLDAACAESGPSGSDSNRIAQALLTVANQLQWRPSDKDHNDGPDVALFAPNFTAATVIGEGGILPSDKVSLGFSLQGHDTYYPPHAHYAEESYWIIGGNADWKVDTKAWFAVKPGDSIYHKPQARHAMQTNEHALLAIWLWTSHLDSEVVIVRG